ncbi:MAG TPA: Asp-tRNA(Asn)/Glu-tRNA(Gln) amidotransferase subunit GatB [Dehalococcoidia bacterium]|nr:Asp-tRNA(Asn)/Glu-tRNA(Gln) amidotransferase subunit GatB [Dehalococcoidia bacterium]
MTATTAVEYETVIGLEVHAQLLTKSKMFCGCSADYANAEPNTHVCPICLGMPGVLPVINRAALEYTVMTGLALNCHIPLQAKFDRKNYPYPDLMKGYQISQYDMPLCRDGFLLVEADGETRRVGVTRVHLEEDTARLLHRLDPETGEGYSLIDVNRSGVPLMEIVSEPDIRSPEQARQYLMKLRQILRYLGVSAANMEEGNFRCDANVSLRPVGSSELGAKVEVKNMNSFRSVARALEYEVERQRAVLDSGGRIPQETRGWLELEGRTASQRSKEHAHDYRYFPDPDLPPIVLTPEWISSIRERIPELPDAKRQRFVATYGLSDYEVGLLIETRARADYYEACVGPYRSEPARLPAMAKGCANWMLGEMARLQNLRGGSIEDAPVPPEHLRELVELIEAGALSSKMAKDVFAAVFETGKPPSVVVQERGLSQLSDEDELARLVDEIIAANPKPAADFRAGKQEALKFLVGQLMRATKGRAQPELANELLRKALSTQ